MNHADTANLNMFLGAERDYRRFFEQRVREVYNAYKEAYDVVHRYDAIVRIIGIEFSEDGKDITIEYIDGACEDDSTTFPIALLYNDADNGFAYFKARIAQEKLLNAENARIALARVAADAEKKEREQLARLKEKYESR